MKIPLFLSLIFLCGASAMAGFSDDLLDQIKSELKAEARAAQAQGQNVQQQAQLRQIEEALEQFQRTTQADRDDVGLLQGVEALGTLTLSEKIESLCHALGTELRASVDKHEVEVQAEMEKTFTGALQTAVAGKTAKDLDAPLMAVSMLVEQNRNRPVRRAKLRTLIMEGNDLEEFLRSWQDYLAALQAGNADEARQNLESILSHGGTSSKFIPRSELLARVNALPGAQAARARGMGLAVPTPGRGPAVREIIASIQKLEDVAPAIVKIEALPRESESVAFASSEALVSKLRSFNVAYEQLKQGVPNQTTMFSLRVIGAGEVTDLFTSLQQKLIMFALPRFLLLPEAEAPHPEENPVTYLERLNDTAVGRQDWPFVERIEDVAKSLNLNFLPDSNGTFAVRSFLVGLNQERAGQMSLAVASYQAALKTGSQVISPETIGAHLAAIKKSSPEEFEKGMQLTLNPPADNRRPFDPRAYGGASPPPPARPSAARPEKPASGVIQVPAKPDAPAAPATANPPIAPAVAPAK